MNDESRAESEPGEANGDDQWEEDSDGTGKYEQAAAGTRGQEFLPAMKSTEPVDEQQRHEQQGSEERLRGQLDGIEDKVRAQGDQKGGKPSYRRRKPKLKRKPEGEPDHRE